MSYKQSGFDLEKMVFGFGTNSNANGYSTKAVPGYFKNGSQLYYVPRNYTFMPFSNMDAIPEFTHDGEAIFTGGQFAGVNRFLQPNFKSRFSWSTYYASRIRLFYKGSGNPYTLGVLSVRTDSSTLFEGSCPSVILVSCQAGGGDGGDARQWSDVLKYLAAGGGGGGSGASSTFYLSLPYDSVIEREVLSISTRGGVVSGGGLPVNVSGANDNVFLTLYGGNRGGDAVDPGGNQRFIAGTGGRGGQGSAWTPPETVSYCNFIANNGDSFGRYINGTTGGTGVSKWSYYNIFGAMTDFGYTNYVLAEDAMVQKLFVDSINSQFPTTLYGKRGSILITSSNPGVPGGTGAGSLFGNGGDIPNISTSNYAGLAGGIGAGGSGGSAFTDLFDGKEGSGGRGGAAGVSIYW